MLRHGHTFLCRLPPPLEKSSEKWKCVYVDGQKIICFIQFEIPASAGMTKEMKGTYRTL